MSGPNGQDSTIEAAADVDVTMKIVLHNAPDDWMSRCFTPEWRSHFYHLRDEDDVHEHLIYNALVNGVDDISRLEGWADIEPGAVRLHVDVTDIGVY